MLWSWTNFRVFCQSVERLNLTLLRCWNKDLLWLRLLLHSLLRLRCVMVVVMMLLLLLLLLLLLHLQ